MLLTYIITINPIQPISQLNLLIQSLNLQTCKEYNVVFYNQRNLKESEILGRLLIQPNFEFTFKTIKKELFLGNYPIWNLYELHNELFEEDKINDYFISLHMEEFLDPDYTNCIKEVLIENDFDLIFGNLSRTKYYYDDLTFLLNAKNPVQMKKYSKLLKLDKSPHWCFPNKNIFALQPRELQAILFNMYYFRFQKKLKKNGQGFTKLKKYIAEDVYWMKKKFALKYNWFLKGHNLPFEDIHIYKKLGKHLENVIEFPVYFNKKKIYHMKHNKYYYQLQDNKFSKKLLSLNTEDDALIALKKATQLYREKKISFKEAIKYSRNNNEDTGTQNINYNLHLKYLSINKGITL
jgi:hypothetical protein